MNWLQRKRIYQIIQYGWTDAKTIAMESGKSRISVFFSILACFKNNYVFSNQYKKNRFWALSKDEKEKLAESIGKLNKWHDDWVIYNYRNRKFLEKWASFKMETTPKRTLKRKLAYTKQYSLGENLHIQYGVTILCEHFSIGKITCGKNVLLARNCDIDYTGDIEIGDNVGILEGVKILTHAHDSYHFMKESDLIPLSNRAYKTNLKIGNNVSICAHAVILPGVTEIGENSIISAGAIVNRPVPPNVIVAGNPAEVVRKIPVGIRRKKH